MATKTFHSLLTQAALPQLEMRLLLQHASSFTHAQILSHALDPVSPKIQKRFDQLIQQRKNGTPIAYLVGRREFYQRQFSVNSHTLIPRPDTELAIETALALASATAKKTVLDLGTGCGIIAITLALEAANWKLTATDCSISAIKVAKKNAKTLGASVQFLVGHWFTPIISLALKFDMIIANPPYIAHNDPHLTMGDLRFEPLKALTDNSNGLSCLKHIVDKAPDFLKPQGWLVLEHGFSQGKAVRCFLQERGFKAIATKRDLGQQERVSIGQLN